MDILDEVTEKFAVTLDTAIFHNPQYIQASEALQKIVEHELSPEKAAELNENVGKLTSAVFHSACKAGMKLGARIEAELLKK